MEELLDGPFEIRKMLSGIDEMVEQLYPFVEADELKFFSFDKADLDQYLKSVSGEFRKDKVCIRWYGGTGKSWGRVPVFIELKSGWGFASSEQRCRVLVPAESLEKPRLASGIVDSGYW